jgi:hypothetical protein
MTSLKNTKPRFQEIISSMNTFIDKAETILKEATQEEMKVFVVEEPI